MIPSYAPYNPCLYHVLGSNHALAFDVVFPRWKVNPDFSLINPFDLLIFDVDLAFTSWPKLEPYFKHLPLLKPLYLSNKPFRLIPFPHYLLLLSLYLPLDFETEVGRASDVTASSPEWANFEFDSRAESWWILKMIWW